MGQSKTKYAPASQSPEEANRAFDKSEKTCCQKCAMYSCGLGFLCMLVGIVCAFVMKSFVQGKIYDNLALVDGSQVFEGWQAPPVTPVMFLRVFNLTNKEAFLSGRENPKVTEIGPYAYRQILKNTDVTFPRNSTISYKMQKQYFFAPEISNGSEDDIVVVPNIPLLGAVKKMNEDGMNWIAKSFFQSLLESFKFGRDTEPFVTVTVKEFLWGYPSVMMSIAKTRAMGCDQLGGGTKQKSDDGWEGFDDMEDDDWGRRRKRDSSCSIHEDNLSEFGILFGSNNTALDLREVNNGEENIHQKGHMISWHGRTTLPYWSTKECNAVAGNDPGMWPLGLEKTDHVDIFIGNLCRALKFKYVKEVFYAETRTFRFSPAENTFDSPNDSPENACYCLTRPCLPSGLLDISGCKPGSPIYMSWPHFMYGDPQLRKDIEGMSPDPEKHSFQFDVVPKYGISLAARARLQMNVIVKPDKDFTWFKDIPKEIVLPFAWLEEGVFGPNEVIHSEIRLLLTLPDNVRNIMALALMVLGLLMLVPEIVFWVKSCFK